MKIALTRRTEKTHHLNYSILMKRTCQIKTVKLVPVFAARWRAICKYFINAENKQPEKQYMYSNEMKKNATHIYLDEEKIFEQQVNTIIIAISIYRNKHKQNTNSRSKKNRECLMQLYEAIIPI